MINQTGDTSGMVHHKPACWLTNCLSVFKGRRVVFFSALLCVCGIFVYINLDRVTVYLIKDSVSENNIPKVNEKVKNKTLSAKLAMTYDSLGHLGNLMGQYAVLLGLAKLNGYKPVLLKEKMDQLHKYFSLSTPTLGSSIEKLIPWKVYRLRNRMKPSYMHFVATFVKFRGLTYSWTFYHHMRQDILREFTFFPSIIQNVQDFLHKTKGSQTRTVTYIGVHVGRGDYINLLKNSNQGMVADRNYLSAAMEEYRSRYSDALFVVCSDDLPWCKTNINLEKEDVIFSWYGRSRGPGEDMALLSQCNHSIMTVGIYGYWASYLTGGDVIYLSNFTSPDSYSNEHLNSNATFLPHWKGIPTNIS